MHELMYKVGDKVKYIKHDRDIECSAEIGEIYKIHLVEKLDSKDHINYNLCDLNGEELESPWCSEEEIELIQENK